MGGPSRSARQRNWCLVAVIVAASALVPGVAEAQARGTLQVYAQVVDTKASYEGLQAAKVALQSGPSGSKSVQAAVSTLASVSVAYVTKQQPAVILTIDYSKN
jgi:hypothetical protein